LGGGKGGSGGGKSGGGLSQLSDTRIVVDRDAGAGKKVGVQMRGCRRQGGSVDRGKVKRKKRVVCSARLRCQSQEGTSRRSQARKGEGGGNIDGQKGQNKEGGGCQRVKKLSDIKAVWSE